MADEKVLVEIVYDTAEAVENIVALNDAIDKQKVKQAVLKENLKENIITWDEYNRKLFESQQTEKKAKDEKSQLIKQINSEEGSINRLRAEVSRLTKERNALNLNTADGQRRLKELNSTIDKHNKVIKDSNDAYGKQKINIGNYPEMLGQTSGAFGGVTNSIIGMTKAAWAFVANPIGLVIAGIALALKALMSYFKGSEEGQNALNKVTKVFGVIVGNISDRVQAVGKQIFEMATKPKEAIEKLGETIKERLINRFEAFGKIGKAILKIFSSEWKQGIIDLGNASGQLITGIEDPLTKMKDAVMSVVNESEKEMKIAARIADREAALIKLQRNWMVEEAKLQREIAEQKLKAANQELSAEERIKALEAAIAAEEKILQTNVKIAKEKAELKRLQNSLSNSTTEDLNEEAQLKADAIRVETDSFNKRKEMASQLSGLKKSLNKKENEDDDKTLERKVKALQELQDFQTEQAIKEQKDLEAKRNMEIAYEDEKLRRAKENAELTAEEILLIEAKSAARKKDIDKDYHDAVKANNEKRKQDALDIAAQATQLSNLLVMNSQNEFTEFENRKNAELKIWEGNEAMQQKIRERYAIEEAKLKEKQFKRDKAKNIIDATMATALAVISALSMKQFIPLGLASAAIAGAMGAAQIGVISAQRMPTFAKGGIIGGQPHSMGGTKFFGSDGSMFEAERGEAMFVLKKDAAAEIAALSMINEAHGGRSFSKGGAHLADGGEVMPSGGVEKIVSDTLKKTPIFVKVGDIETGLTDFKNVKQAGVI